MKRLAFFCLCSTLCATENVYLLPHRWQDARHELTALIRSAPSGIVIVSDAVDDTYIRRALRRALEKKKPVTFITGSEKTASAWAIYASADVCLLSAPGPLAFSLVVAGKRACIVNLPLTTDALRERYGVMQCTDAGTFDETITLLKQECKGYFDE